MREIKFRGKRVDNGEWAEGDLARRKSRFISHLDTTYGISDEHGTFCAVDPATVGQFTGLHDKNGKEVYEGDIVSIWRDGLNRKFTVKWRETGVPMYILYPQPLNDNFWHCRSDMKMAWEVIGNIHNNPELL